MNRSWMLAVAALILLPGLAEADYTFNITMPSPPPTSYAVGAAMTVAGNFSYSSTWDTWPYYVFYRIKDSNGVVVSEGHATNFSASFGSGTFSQGFTCPSATPGQLATAFAQLRDSADQPIFGTGYTYDQRQFLIASPTPGGGGPPG